MQEIKTALETVRGVLDLTTSLVYLNDSTAATIVNTAITTAIDLVQSLLTSFLDDVGAYILAVPLPKKGLLAVATSPLVQDEPGSNYVMFPDSAVLSLLNSDVAASLRSSPSFGAIFDAPTYSLGGNAYLVNTIAGSVYDAGDRNRPKFTKESYWAYVLLVAGATDLTSILGAVTSLDRLFSWPRHANSLTPSRGVGAFVPAGVRAVPSGRGVNPVIEWDHVQPSAVLTGYDGATIEIRQYAIIRSTDLRAKTVTKVLDLFSTTDLKEEMTGVYGSKVIKIGNYDGVLDRYVEKQALDADKTYYYHVAFNTRITGSPDGADSGNNSPRSTSPYEQTPDHVDIPFELLSSAAEWRQPSGSASRSSSQLSEAPDWYRTPSVARLIPGLNRVVDIVIEELENLRTRSTSANARLHNYLNLIAGHIAYVSARIDTLNAALNQITAVFNSIDAGIYATVRYGQGPTGNFIADVVKAIDDPADPKHPPFTVGDEYVAGALALVVSPDLTIVNSAMALFELLFGGASNNAALAGINSVTTTLAQAEQSLLDQISGGGTAPTNASIAFGTDMQPRPLGEPDASCT